MRDTEPTKLITIVEDDPDVAKIIEQVLADFGFRTAWCRSGGDLLRRLRTLAPDLCIIDLGLPDMDGIEAMQRVRAQSGCGILILTGRAHVSDRVMGLEMGADDYVLKPFEPRELVARVQTVMRRQRSAGLPHRLQFEGLEIDLDTHAVLRHGEPVALTGTEFALLALLAREPGKVVSRDDILNHLRGHEADLYTRAVDILISRLRKKLDPLDCIRTMRNAGYALALTRV